MALQTYTATVRIRGERPGIGAVVAMVAAGKVWVGDWRPGKARRPPGRHWALRSHSPWTVEACGYTYAGTAGWHDFVDDPNNATCPDCLAIARKAGILS